MADEVVSHAFSHGFHPQHTERLAAYWAEALGGPIDLLGDGTATRPRWSGCTAATASTRRWTVARSPASTTRSATSASMTMSRCGRILHDYFAWATTTTMARYHESADDVPEGLRIPRWSWDGLQT